MGHTGHASCLGHACNADVSMSKRGFCRCFSPSRFVLHPMPLSLDYDEMERLLLGTAHVLAWARKKRTAGGGFEEFLGEFLDAIYKKSGVLIDVPGQQQQAAAASGAPAAATGGPGMGVPGSASKQNLWEAAKSVGPAVPGA